MELVKIPVLILIHLLRTDVLSGIRRHSGADVERQQQNMEILPAAVTDATAVEPRR